MNARKLVGAVLCCLFLAACSDMPAIDQYFTFDLTHHLTFAVSDSAAGRDTSFTIPVTVDTTADYAKQGTGSDLLHSAIVTRVQVTTSDPAFNFANLSSARLLIGSDIVADSIYVRTDTTGATEYLLATTGKEIINTIRNPSFNATLQFALLHPISSSVTITATTTTSYTALPR